MKVLIIGLGSIGVKHICAIRSIDPKAEILALRSGLNTGTVEGVINLNTWEEIPDDLDFIIISNPTSEHFRTIIKASETGLPLFIEKPPLANLDGIEDLLKNLERNKNITYVAFVLRFHPVIQWLKINLDKKRVTEVQAYCGSYLPDWRPGRDYRMTYSAHKELGGGVHLDLIHEIDYLRWFFGDPAAYNAFLSRKSALEINSVDSAHYYLEYENMNISVILNYFRKDAKRIIEIVMHDETVNADLLSYKITSSTGAILFECEPNNIKMFEDQMRYFLNCLRIKEMPENNFEYSMKTLEIAVGK